MKNSVTLTVVSVITFVFISSGCVKKPLAEIESARKAIEKAKEADAPTYAPDEFQSAQNFLEKANKQMDEGEYPAARASAISAKNLAEEALEKALKAKEKAKTQGEEKTEGQQVLPEVGKVALPTVVAIKDEDIIANGSGGKGVVVKQLENVYFAFDDFSLSDEARETLKKNAEWLKSFLESNPDYVVLIEGHCDERGTEEYNLALGQRRADSVKNYLVALSIDSERIQTVSYGESVPADPRHTVEAWAKNRRAVFVLIKKQ